MEIVHYIIVRRDLPVGKLATMIAHAAGESAALFEDHTKPIAIGPYMVGYDVFRGSVVVVLEAKNETHLKAIAKMLQNYGVEHVEITESNGTYANQLMALGLVPKDRAILGPKLAELQVLKGCLTNSEGHETIEKSNDNEASSSDADISDEGVLAGYGHAV